MTKGGAAGTPKDPRSELIEHLKFLREMGVKEIRAGVSAPTSSVSPPPRPSSSPTPAREAPKPAARPEAVTGVKAAALEALRNDAIGDCRRCRLCEKRTKIVFGTGSAEARLMFVGEGPGHDEDLQGVPFVGRAGQLLTDIIGAMKLKREQVYIANVVKCRPPENRTPEDDEIETCRPFLEKQIEIIAPAVIVCLGAVAVSALLGVSGGITKIRGTLRAYRDIPVMPTFHPAYLLRSPDKKRDVWQDMQKVMALLAADPGSG